MKKKYLLFIFILILQLGILSGIIYKYQFILNTGTEVLAKIQAFDPRDIFRGDYVYLNYDIPYSGNKLDYLNLRQNDIVYIVPKMNGNKIIGIENIFKTKPDGFFIKAKIRHIYIYNIIKIKIYKNDPKILEYNYYGGGIKYKKGDNINVYFWCEDEDYEQNCEKEKISFIEKIGFQQDFYKQHTKLFTGFIIDLEEKINIQFDWSVDRFFIKEGTGREYEQKLITGENYAVWMIGKGGDIVLKGVLLRGVFYK